MMQCRCGGLISQAELTSGRERWHCLSCGAYEIFERPRRLDLTPDGRYDSPALQEQAWNYPNKTVKP